MIEDVMLKMGFRVEWVELVMRCVKTVSYSMVLNGQTRGFILLTRGLRQSDPLSPFLFLFCTEGSFALLRLALQDGLVKWAKVSRSRPTVSHLFFADDSHI